jgi:hypothetical protein
MSQDDLKGLAEYENMADDVTRNRPRDLMEGDLCVIALVDGSVWENVTAYGYNGQTDKGGVIVGDLFFFGTTQSGDLLHINQAAILWIKKIKAPIPEAAPSQFDNLLDRFLKAFVEMAPSMLHRALNP